MPGIFKPTYKDKRTGKVKRVSRWWGWYRDQNGKKHRVPLGHDRAASTRMLNDLIAEREREATGIVEPFAAHRKRPLSEHLADWLQSLLAKASNERSKQTAQQTYGRAARVMNGCGIELISQINASRVYEFIAGLRHDAPPTGNRKQRVSLSPQTLNFYLKSCQQFCRWLVRDRRTPDSPLAHLAGWNVRTDRRHDRRALELDEIAWLLGAAKASTWEFRGLAGEDRFVLYGTALGTGLRASELANLAPRDFHLDAQVPVVRLSACYSKNKQEVAQPLPADLVLVIREYVARRAAGQPIWPGTWTERAARMVRKDLAAARKAWLAVAKDAEDRARREESNVLLYRDADGRVADFHSLRHTYITRLAKSGVSPQMAQALARHGDINLTMRVYTHLSLIDTAAALDAVPGIMPKPKDEKEDAG